MKKEYPLSLRVIYAQWSDTFMLYGWIVLPLMLLVMVPFFLLLARWFPSAMLSSRLGIPSALFLLYYLLNFVFLFYKVHLSGNKIHITWCGLTVKTLEPKELKLLCAVGNEWGNHLCLTYHTAEELAQREEAKMLKNWITRHEVPFLKNKANYIDSMAKKQLFRLLRKSFFLFRKDKTVFLPMGTELFHQLRELYPQLPYKNYTECQKYRVKYYCNRNETLSIYGLTPYFRPDFTEDAIVYYSGKKLVRTVPLSEVRSIVRIDLFTSPSKGIPCHLPLLFLSTLTLSELADKSNFSHNSTDLRAYNYAYDQGKRWRIKTPNCCNLPCTEEMITRLKKQCPNARWLDLSDSWLLSSPCPITKAEK